MLKSHSKFLSNFNFRTSYSQQELVIYRNCSYGLVEDTHDVAETDIKVKLAAAAFFGRLVKGR